MLLYILNDKVTHYSKNCLVLKGLNICLNEIIHSICFFLLMVTFHRNAR